MSETVSIQLADFSLRLEFDRTDAARSAGAALANFLAPAGNPDISLRVHYDQWPELTGWERVFDADNTWELFRSADGYAIRRASSMYALDVGMTTIVDRHFRQGDVYIHDRGAGEQPPDFDHFWLQALFINLLSRGNGVLFHAAAVDDHGVGRLFVGNSEAGKSTMSGIWQSSGQGRVLCDDRVVVRKRNGEFWIYGTPWYGTAGIAIPDAAPLRQIFILKQAQQNRALALNPIDAATRLLTRAFPTFWDPEGMAFTLDFIAGLSQAVPCYDLEFRKQPDVIDYVRCLSSP